MHLSFLIIATITAAIFSFLRTYLLEMNSGDVVFGRAAFLFTVIALIDGIISIRQLDAAIQSDEKKHFENRIIFYGLFNGFIVTLMCFVVLLGYSDGVSYTSLILIFLYTFGKSQNALFRMKNMFKELSFLILFSSLTATILTFMISFSQGGEFKQPMMILVMLLLPQIIIGFYSFLSNFNTILSLNYTESTKHLLDNFGNIEFSNLYIVSTIGTVTERTPVLITSYFGDYTLAGKVFFIRQLMSPISTITSAISQYYQPKIAFSFQENDKSRVWIVLHRFLLIGITAMVVALFSLYLVQDIVRMYREDLIGYYHYFYLFTVIYGLQFSSIPFYPLILQLKLLANRNYFLSLNLIISTLASLISQNLTIFFEFYILGSVFFRVYNYLKLREKIQ